MSGPVEFWENLQNMIDGGETITATQLEQMVAAGLATADDARRTFSGGGGGGLSGEDYSEQIRRAGGTSFDPSEGIAGLQGSIDHRTTISDSTVSIETQRGLQSALRGLGANNTGISQILDAVNKIKQTSVLGDGQLDPYIGIEAGMSQLTNLLAGGLATGISTATGGAMDSDTTKAIVDGMMEYGASKDMVDMMKNVIDSNKDGEISQSELDNASVNKNIMDKLTSIDATTAKMFRDPSFRVRVIKKINVPSIYGEDFMARFNQVSQVEQSIGLDNQSANQFNVGF